MKKLLIGTIVASFTTVSAFAGDLAEPAITEVDEPEAAASSTGWLPWLLLIGVGVLVASQDDNAAAPPDET